MMRNTPSVLLRVALFSCVLFAFAWILDLQLTAVQNVSVIIGGMAAVFPAVWLARLILDRFPGRAALVTTFLHAVLMILFGASIIRAVTTVDTWRGWPIPIPGEVGLVLSIITGTAAFLAVLNLAVRGLGAPFAIALSRRLAVDWLYAWTRNPMALATLAFLIALGLWFQSAFFVLWAGGLVAPALLFFIKVFEEQELALRFGSGYREYKSRTPMLLPRRPRAPARRRTSGKRPRQ